MEAGDFKLIRSLLGYTQLELARALDITSNTVARWERGDLGIPDREAQRIRAIAAAGPSGTAITRPKGVVRDPHHRVILVALQEKLDPEVFEMCAVDLIAEDGWSVVPVPGGRDEGFDGAVSDGENEPFPLIVTTSKDPIRNLKKNLKQVQRKGWTAEKVIFATSRIISGTRRRQLRKEAQELGFKILQCYSQDWFANRLYSNPNWCRKLLGVTGTPRALSAFPIARGPILGDAVLGRQEEMQWLLDRRSDSLLLGGPATGKTFLLRSLVQQKNVFFLVDGNGGQIGNDLRELRPTAVIVDDAHTRMEWIQTFVQIRREIGAEHVWLIVTSWPSHSRDLIDELNLTEEDVCSLQLLDADTIVEIIKSAGVKGPNELLAVIRHQAAGRPGLATTLAHLCLAGNLNQVESGEALFNRLAPAMGRLLDKKIMRVMAPFALAGDRGAQYEKVAEYLGISKLDVSDILANLSASGIVQVGPSNAVSVVPAQFRWVLVKEMFFGGIGSLNYKTCIDIAENPSNALHTLIGAYSRGARVHYLVDHLESASSLSLWESYVQVGPSETNYVVENHAEILPQIAESALFHLPRTVIPLLLDNVRSEHLRINSGPMRDLEKWAIHGSPNSVDILQRRSMLAQATVEWWSKTGNHNTAIHSMCIALSPKYEYVALDPGMGLTMTSTEGVLNEAQLRHIFEFWPFVLEILGAAEEGFPWHCLFQLISDWALKGQRVPLADEAKALAQCCEEQMWREVTFATCRHPGVQHLIRNLAPVQDPVLAFALDPEFESFYPIPKSFSPPEHESLAEDLARQLESLSIDELTGLLKRNEARARFAGFQIPSPVFSTACIHLAKAVSDPGSTAEVFIQQDLPSSWVKPFLNRAATENMHGWIPLLNRCLETDQYENLGFSVLLRHPGPPAELLSAGIREAGRMLEVVEECCLLNLVPDTTLESLFGAQEDCTAAVAAVGHWFGRPNRQVPSSHRELWREAFLRSAHVTVLLAPMWAYRLEEILAKDSNLARDWLIAKCGHECKWFFGDWQKMAEKAVMNMSVQERRTVLRSLSPCSANNLEGIIRLLVGENLDLYGEFLARAGWQAACHLSPLECKIDQTWIEKVKLAMNEGHSASEVIRASLPMNVYSFYNESEMWFERRLAFEALYNFDEKDPRILDLARLGAKEMKERENEARKRDRDRAVQVFP